MTAEQNKSIAATILEQLGGNRFLVMTGAKQLSYGEATLNFRLPSNFATDGINCVQIELKPSDTYTIKFGKLRGLKYTPMGEVEDVYNDNLRAVFTAHTGLDCTL